MFFDISYPPQILICSIHFSIDCHCACWVETSLSTYVTASQGQGNPKKCNMGLQDQILRKYLFKPFIQCQEEVCFIVIPIVTVLESTLWPFLGLVFLQKSINICKTSVLLGLLSQACSNHIKYFSSHPFTHISFIFGLAEALSVFVKQENTTFSHHGQCLKIGD